MNSLDYIYKGKVLRVIDGDTVDILVHLGFGICSELRFRLAGIDAPEIYGVKHESEEYRKGIVAKERLEELIWGKEVVLYSHKDSSGGFGRYLADIYIDDGKTVQEALLSEGLVDVYTK